MNSKELTKCIIKGIICAELIMSAIVASIYFIATGILEGMASTGAPRVRTDFGVIVIALVFVGLFVCVARAFNSSDNK